MCRDRILDNNRKQSTCVDLVVGASSVYFEAKVGKINGYHVVKHRPFPKSTDLINYVQLRVTIHNSHGL
jgi:hypothetical protein